MLPSKRQDAQKVSRMTQASSVASTEVSSVPSHRRILKRTQPTPLPPPQLCEAFHHVWNEQRPSQDQIQLDRKPSLTTTDRQLKGMKQSSIAAFGIKPISPYMALLENLSPKKPIKRDMSETINKAERYPMFLRKKIVGQIKSTMACSDVQSASQHTIKKKDALASHSPTSRPSEGTGKLRVSSQDFQIMRKIGKGAFGDVFLAREIKTSMICVLKKLSKKKIREENLIDSVVRQIKIQSFFQDRHLVSLYGFFSQEDHVFLIMEAMVGGNLLELKGSKVLAEPIVAKIVREICLGLRTLHEASVIHRDIKPENILLCDDYAKIGDFGCSIYSSILRYTMIGSIMYNSPEQLDHGQYNHKIDVWSVGLLTYELLCGETPFHQDIIKTVFQGKPADLSQLTFHNTELTNITKNFIRKLLIRDPIVRPSIIQALQHPFLSGGT